MNEYSDYTEAEIHDLLDDVRKRQKHIPPPRKIASAVNTQLARKGYAGQQNANQLDAVWKRVVGEKFSGHSRVGNVKRGVLEITVRNSTILQELTFQKKPLLEKLTKQIPDQKIQNLRFRVGSIDY